MTKKQKAKIYRVVRALVQAVGVWMVAHPALFSGAESLGSLLVGLGGAIAVGEPNEEKT